jgi:hypothetical protein
LYQQNPLDGEFGLGEVVGVRAFHSINVPTAVSFPLAEMNVRRMRMIVRE